MLNNSEIENFYRGALNEHGASARGVGWKDTEAQEVRFRQLIKIIDPSQPFSINDLGCGTGDLLNLLNAQFKDKYTYNGYDGLDEMITLARKQFPESKSVKFRQISDYNQMTACDYSVASGIFNVRNTIGDDDWQAHIMSTITAMSVCSKKGFAFNALTTYSDADKMRSDLFYSDPLVLFDYCKKHFSRNVALLHDYGIYDFTILVRK